MITGRIRRRRACSSPRIRPRDRGQAVPGLRTFSVCCPSCRARVRVPSAVMARTRIVVTLVAAAAIGCGGGGGATQMRVVVPPDPLPALVLQAGSPYFSVGGTHRVVMSRNITGRTPDEIDALID